MLPQRRGILQYKTIRESIAGRITCVIRSLTLGREWEVSECNPYF